MYVELDFETYSKVDLKKSGQYAYAEDESTGILCLYWLEEGQTTPSAWRPIEGEPFPERLIELASDKSVIFMAHNASFERAIWREQLTKGKPHLVISSAGAFLTAITAPDIPRSRWVCSAATAAAHSLPRALEKVAKVLDTNIKKDMAGNRTMLKMSKPRKATKKDNAPWHYKPEDYQTTYDYCANDVLTENEIYKQLKPLSYSEQMAWIVDQCINDRGVTIDIELAEAALKIHATLVKEYNAEITELTDGAVTKVTEVSKLQSWFGEQGLNISSVDKDTLESLVLRDDVSDLVKRVATLRMEGSKTSINKYAAALRCVCKDGKVRGLHLFNGANTGRFSGRLVQTQNLPRGVIKNAEDMDAVVSEIKAIDVEALKKRGDVSTILSSAIRGMFIAGEGEELVVADYAAIEARVLVWMAQDEEALRIFRNGEDIYKDMAADIYHKKAEDVEPHERQLGKQAILGLGYGMGWRKFIETCLAYKIDITESLAQRVVELYRSKYNRNKQLWAAADAAAIRTVETGPDTPVGCLLFRIRGQFLECVLPSGRPIRYYRPSVAMAETSWGEERKQLHYYGENDKGQWVRQSIYGAKIIQHATQGIARDLLVHALVNAEKGKKYRPVLHVHDELVTVCKRGEGDIKEFEGLIAELPAWGEGIPLVAEGWIGHRYRK